MLPFFSVIQDSFRIWSRNTALIYVYLLTVTLLTWLLPRSVFQVAAPTEQKLLLAVVLTLLLAALLSGWFTMIAQACENFYQAEPASKKSITDERSFKLFTVFLPGISKNFLSIAVGLSIQFLVAFLLYYPVTQRWIEISPLIDRVAATKLNDVQQVLTLFNDAEKNVIQSFSWQWIVSSFQFLAISILVMFWAPYTILHKKMSLVAFGLSAKQYFKYPVSCIFLVFGFFTAGVLFYLLSLLGTLFLMNQPVGLAFVFVLLQVFAMLTLVFCVITLFVFVSRFPVQKNAVAIQTNSEESSNAENATDSDA
ncbi:MAG: hypothetical protein AAGI66_05585 [Cyanobacteria bacterium P01_H01_bin.74]